MIAIMEFSSRNCNVGKGQQRVEHDMHTIRNWSLALDMKIVALTVVRGFAGPGAY